MMGEQLEVPESVPLVAVRGFGVPVNPIDLTGVEYMPGLDGSTPTPCPFLFEGLRGALHNGDHLHLGSDTGWVAIVLHPDAIGDLIARSWHWARQTGQEGRVIAAFDQVQAALKLEDLK